MPGGAAASSVRRAQSCHAAVDGASTKLPLLSVGSNNGSEAVRPCSVDLGLGVSSRNGTRSQRSSGASSLPPRPGGKGSRSGSAVPDKLPAIGGGELPALGPGKNAVAKGASGPMALPVERNQGYGRPTSAGRRPPRAPQAPVEAQEDITAAARTAARRPLRKEVPSSSTPTGTNNSTSAKSGYRQQQRQPQSQQAASLEGSASSSRTPTSTNGTTAKTASQQQQRQPQSLQAASTQHQPTVSEGQASAASTATTASSAGKEQQPAADPLPKSSKTSKDKGRDGGSNGLRHFVSDELREVMDEEAVTYSWRRASAPPAPKQKTIPVAEENHEKSSEEKTEAKPQTSKPIPDQSPSQSPSEPKQLNAKVEKPSRGVRFAAGSNDSRELVVAATGGYPNKSERSKPDMGPATGALDLDRGALGRQPGLVAGQFRPAARLVAYDGQPPHLAGGPLSGGSSSSRGPPPSWIARWLRGRCSGALACLFADHWLQGEVAWPESEGSFLQKSFGTAAGMLADACLGRAPIDSLRKGIFACSPTEAVSSAVAAVLEAAARDVADAEQQELLVSEAECALARLEARALGAVTEQSAARLAEAVRRELLRLLWCPDSCDAKTERAPRAEFDDDWLLKQLRRPAAAVEEAMRDEDLAELRRQNQFLDGYLVRLLRLKRSLVALLDEWEKVDHYEILGVPSSATDKELKNAYRKACLRLHPDKGGDKVQFQQLQDAYARILEERAKKQKDGGAGSTQAAASSQKGASATASGPASKKSPAPAGEQLALEPAMDGSPERVAAETPEAAQEVIAAIDRLHEQAEIAKQAIQRCEKADATLKELRKSPGGVAALATAQEAGEALSELSQKLGELAPELGEAVMEVAEVSLCLAARFAAVPAALLLTDVALSCTLEASRLQHAGKQLLDVRKDTISTLQTLKTNLSMAKIIGTVDAETLKLSLGLVGKAATRIMASVRQASSALGDARQRCSQCSVHAKAVCRFAEGRSAAEAEAEEAEQAALPAPEGCEAAPPGVASSSPSGRKDSEGSPSGKAHAPEQGTAPKDAAQESAWRQGAAVLQARLQNDRLLRQLNSELLDLQRRVRANLATGAKRPPPGADAAVEDRHLAFDLAAEVLLAATEDTLEDFVTEPQGLEAALSRHFAFIDVAGSELLAAPLDVRAQLLRLAVLLDSQAVLHALEQQVKPRLAARCAQESDDLQAPLLTALGSCVEKWAAAVISVKLA
eukprot:TRINITY_DN27727_c0_g1_i1.p1 TRINITY_DN27727_c0_g1~~TRINITY_DN27727_c0_g1_i1.p1  ORF type:complete len:1228 (+),score=279.05 TRINITY_DN27727_c0_g1_i1:76-3759(+)